MTDHFLSRLYLVISEGACKGRDIIWVAEQAIKGGADLVQIREKYADAGTFRSTAFRLKEMLDGYSVPLIVNDNLSIAISCGAAGIHVGNTDIPPSEIRQQWRDCSLLGYSIEYEDQLSGTEIQHAGYLGISPVFSTATKTDTVTEWKLEGIARIRSLTDKPLVAIGNMNATNAYEVIRAGADCLAAVSAICGAQDPEKAAALIRNEIEKAL